MNILNPFRIEWDLHEFGPRTEPVRVQPDLAAHLDFSRFEYARAVAAGYVPANARRYDEHEAA